MSWDILGQDLTVSALRNSIQDGKFGHAYLIVGPPMSGRSTLAYLMAQAANCLEEEPPCGQCNQCQRIQRRIHTDIQIVVPEINERTGRINTEITIDQIRELEKSAILGPYEGKSRVFIIDGAELLSEEAANSLLKILEEPPERGLVLGGGQNQLPLEQDCAHQTPHVWPQSVQLFYVFVIRENL